MRIFFFKNKRSKISTININGFSGNIKAFSMTREINPITEKNWIKIDLPASKIDRLVLPGGIDVDNFKFMIDTIQHYDIAIHFHTNYVRNVEELIKDSDI